MTSHLQRDKKIFLHYTFVQGESVSNAAVFSEPSSKNPEKESFKMQAESVVEHLGSCSTSLKTDVKRSMRRINYCLLVTGAALLAVVAAELLIIILQRQQPSHNAGSHAYRVNQELQQEHESKIVSSSEPVNQLLQMHHILLSAFVNMDKDKDKDKSNQDNDKDKNTYVEGQEQQEEVNLDVTTPTTSTDATSLPESTDFSKIHVPAPHPGIVPASSCNSGYARDFLGKCRPVMRGGRKR